MFDRLHALIERLHDVAEANALTDRDLNDLGVGRDQLLAFLRMPPDITERLTAMAAIFGVPKDDLRRHYPQWIDLLATCGLCPDRAACRKVLDKGSAATPEDAAFCSNRPAFAEVAHRPI